MDINYNDSRQVGGQNTSSPKQVKAKKTPFFLVLLLIIAVLAAGYFYWQWSVLKSNPAISGAEDIQDLVKEVSKIMLLPDELPTVATVTDPAALTDQPFFTNAQVGYKVLVFPLAKKAVLYDPVNKRIIEIGPVSDAPADSGATNVETKEVPKKN
jgi:hypothetical protein